MEQRHAASPFKQMVSLEERLAEEATRLRGKRNRFHPALPGSKHSESSAS